MQIDCEAERVHRGGDTALHDVAGAAKASKGGRSKQHAAGWGSSARSLAAPDATRHHAPRLTPPGHPSRTP